MKRKTWLRKEKKAEHRMVALNRLTYKLALIWKSRARANVTLKPILKEQIDRLTTKLDAAMYRR